MHPERPHQCPVDHCAGLHFHRNCIRPHMEEEHPDLAIPPEYATTDFTFVEVVAAIHAAGAKSNDP